jgi:hypothetical protein
MYVIKLVVIVNKPIVVKHNVECTVIMIVIIVFLGINISDILN